MKSPSKSPAHPISHAPKILGAFFCLSFALCLTSCKKSQTPSWDEPGVAPPAQAPATPTLPDVSAPTETIAPQPKLAPSNKASQALRFLEYNVENWLSMDRYEDNKAIKHAPKPESEKAAAIDQICSANPDAIGVCEIGTPADLEDIQQRLKQKGHDFPYTHYTGGSDPVRHLGFLSRFPITSTAKPAHTDFTLQGKAYAINRGILDVTITANDATYRFLGVHLKSKREAEGFDQEEMRIQEANLLRQHIDSIFDENREARLIVYGDFNDTRKTTALEHVSLNYSHPRYLTAVPVSDSKGYRWTHHWDYQDIYSRIDFVFVSRALRPEVDFKASHIIDNDTWSQASDHRPLLVIFK